MTLDSFAVERYRGFKERTEIKIRPLTLLFGYNSAGKSALLRVLPLLRDTLRTGRDPIDFGSEVVCGATFRELHCRFSGAPTIAVELASESEAMRYVIRDLAGEDRQIVEVVTRRTDDGEQELEWTTEGDSYELSRSGVAVGTHNLRFSGLAFQSSGSGEESLSWDPPASAMLRQVQWLDAVRSRVSRLIPYGARPRGPLASDGRDAPSSFAHALEDGSQVARLVQEFYLKHLGHRIDAQKWAERFRLQLSLPSTPTLGYDLTDTGEGLSQVLPIAVAVARAATPEGPNLLALEQPELHLHPRLHSELAKWLTSIVQRAPEVRMLIETHSENVLLSVMLAVIKGELSADQVLIYWVHQLDDGQSVVDEITMDTLARLQGPWPNGVFQEDSILATELNNLRLARLRG